MQMCMPLLVSRCSHCGGASVLWVSGWIYCFAAATPLVPRLVFLPLRFTSKRRLSETH